MLGIRSGPDPQFNHPAMKTIGRLFVPAALGGSVYQINVLVGTFLASTIPNAVSWLWYADRLVELPLGIFAIALGTAVLPIHVQAGWNRGSGGTWRIGLVFLEADCVFYGSGFSSVDRASGADSWIASFSAGTSP